jgi:(2Fe-2S) ferredoxin
MEKPKHHLFVCASFRVKGDPKGVCHKKSGGFLQYLEDEISGRGLDAQVSATGCLKQCDHGPVMVVYPQGVWYGGLDGEEALDAVLDSLEEGGVCEKYLLA